MILRKKRVRSIRSALPWLTPGSTVVIALTDLFSARRTRLEQVGFTANQDYGETVLPAALGPVSTYNSEGRFIVHKDRPKETAYRQVEWHWQEWHGQHTIDRSKVVDVPYERYPRTFVPPPGVELSISSDTRGVKCLVSTPMKYSTVSDETVIHVINLYLELFGECAILQENLDQYLLPRIQRLNWQVLPPGKRPWPQLKTLVRPIVQKAPEGNQAVIFNRLETVNKHRPDFTALGRAGFSGYIVFGFPAKGLFVLESIYQGNATYVFGDRWETLSQLTKAQILDDGLHRARIIHREGWVQQVNELLNPHTDDDDGRAFTSSPSA